MPPYIMHSVAQTQLLSFSFLECQKYYLHATSHARTILINTQVVTGENHVGTNIEEEHSVSEALSHCILYSNRGKARQSEMDCYLGGA